MPNSPLRKYPYPSISDSAIVPNDLRRLAEAVDADVSTVAGSAISAVTRAAELAELVSGIRSIQTIKVDDGGSTATITYTNGTTERITLPRGPAGESAGPFVDLIDNGDGTATVILYDGTTRTLTLPEGEPGAPGDPGPANSLTIGSVTSGSAASATITGTPPSQTLDLVLPKGEKGDPGDAGEATTPDTGTRNIGTEAGGASIGNVRVRRVGSLVALAFSGAIPASGSLRWNYPTGFKPIDSMTGHRAGWNITKENFFPFQVAWNATTVPSSGGGPVAGDYVSAVVQYITADPWPSTLPGTPG